MISIRGRQSNCIYHKLFWTSNSITKSVAGCLGADATWERESLSTGTFTCKTHYNIHNTHTHTHARVEFINKTPGAKL